MGREVRRVPADWQHPKDGHYANGKDRYRPLFPGEDYASRKEAWEASLAKHGLQKTLEEEGDAPNAEDYMPNWPEAERTHCMMYEDTSEGTPISPAFATPEELARWLADTNASAFGGEGASYEAWLAVARGGWAPSAVIVGGVMKSGVEFAAEKA